MSIGTFLAIPLVVVAVAGCGSSVSDASAPPAAASGTRATASAAITDPTEIARAHALGPWRPAPILPDERQVDAVIEACRVATVGGGNKAVGDLPVAVVDARGEGRFVIVFADRDRAVGCRATVDDAEDPTVDGTEVLDPGGAVSDTGISIVSIGPDTDRADQVRKTLIGRVGSKAFKVKAHFADDTYVNASMANGWYVAWWPGRDDPITVAAVDNRSVAISGTAP